ncbi:Hypothetical protein R9X50_00480400 [Acrodontium crateriforme]|uniref:Uncharacterized protein n=1 Tax=Acrodontium crateriforme TaxID=150365 RepID=A0AAQ3RB28_9PEZI|nr:Hypothetical protein R9X50_00480400 [Acrodontium crateriforme]
MAVVSRDSASSLPAARRVHVRSKSHAARTGVSGPTYTIQRDAPWMADTKHDSMYSDGVDNNHHHQQHPHFHAHPADGVDQRKHETFEQLLARNACEEGIPADDPGHFHVRSSRLPLFKQVRGLLNKHSPIHHQNPLHSHEQHHPVLHPSNPTRSFPAAVSAASPYESPLNPNNPPSSICSTAQGEKSKLLPKALRIGVINSLRVPPELPPSPAPLSPLSRPITSNSSQSSTTNKPVKAQQPHTNDTLDIQRTNSSVSDWSWTPSASVGIENLPKDPDSSSGHFSWANFPRPSFTRGRAATIESASSPPANINLPPLPSIPFNIPSSRFSWSTAHGGAGNAITAPGMEPQNAPPTTPLPPIPSKSPNRALKGKKSVERTPSTATSLYNPVRGPPVQSILSRRRPVQRLGKEEWDPPARIRTDGGRSFTSPLSAPQSKDASGKPQTPNFSRRPSTAVDGNSYGTLDRTISNPMTRPSTSSSNPSTPGSTSKELPPPPSLQPPNSANSVANNNASIFSDGPFTLSKFNSQPTHLETLLVQEHDILHQRRNTEKLIAQLDSLAHSSPLDVPFAAVRETNEQLKTHRRRLEQILLEEREIGVKIARARRKEDEGLGGGLWVRRVMG